ncbi:MAG: hypothetical protein AAF197_04375 [Pseudomonadota bacterium]
MALVMLEPGTKENVSGFWPTVTAASANKEVVSSQSGKTIVAVAKLNFPTPNAVSARQGVNSPDGKRGQTLLGAAISQYWPTPQARDYKGGMSKTKVIERMNAHSRGVSPPEQVQRNHLEKDDGQPLNGQLNPEWVEWLMGWVKGWSSLKPLKQFDVDNNLSMIADGTIWNDEPHAISRTVESKTVLNRIGRIQALGNGQVPLCFALAFKLLVEPLSE